MIGLSLAGRHAGEEGVSQADIVAVGSSSSRRCTDNLKQLHGSSPLYYVHLQTGAIMPLPPTDLNLFVHVHFQLLLWKAAAYMGPLDVSISAYGREMKDWIMS